MGNCQAADSATVVIQHHGGKVERLYWPITAREVMRSNPGHYVALVTLCRQEEEKRENNGIRFTRVKLLRPKDMLLLGQVYRLVTAQEVMKGLWAKKYARMKKNQSESIKKREREREPKSLESVTEAKSEMEVNQEENQDRHQPKPKLSGSRSSRHWRPSLHSISELGS
ncbi:D-ribose-binding periplasmic protein [Tasmannia lanceolata]|uniref:D-ribose-binding periplasmic protein n=1 Tax=Tasmannia lanceolata TaxID=3420 RepID=UPI0040628976